MIKYEGISPHSPNSQQPQPLQLNSNFNLEEIIREPIPKYMGKLALVEIEKTFIFIFHLTKI